MPMAANFEALYSTEPGGGRIPADEQTFTIDPRPSVRDLFVP